MEIQVNMCKVDQISKDLRHYPPLHQTLTPPPLLPLGQYQTHHPQWHALHCTDQQQLSVPQDDPPSFSDGRPLESAYHVYVASSEKLLLD